MTGKPSSADVDQHLIHCLWPLSGGLSLPPLIWRNAGPASVPDDTSEPGWWETGLWRSNWTGSTRSWAAIDEENFPHCVACKEPSNAKHNLREIEHGKPDTSPCDRIDLCTSSIRLQRFTTSCVCTQWFRTPGLVDIEERSKERSIYRRRLLKSESAGGPRRTLARSQACDRRAEITRECVTGRLGTRTYLTDFSVQQPT